MTRAADVELEEKRRAVVFAWLERQKAIHGEVLPFSVLQQGAEFQGRRQPVMHLQRGIYQPAESAFALTLRSSLADPYGDRFDEEDGTLIYGMEAGGTRSSGNLAMAASYRSALPLLYLRQVGSRTAPRFLAIHPVWIVAVNEAEQKFHVETSEAALLRIGGASVSGEFGQRIERAYATRRIKARLHQADFRERVLEAYLSRCAMCQLRERALLEAAHIVPDSAEGGDPVVPNGLALCKIHHGAFDAHLISIHPVSMDVRVLPRLLAEKDGPMLQHGIKELQGHALQLPRAAENHPDPARLKRHWDSFQAIAAG